MDLNKETAKRLWIQQFGNKQRAVDFTGREIMKAAYNDRNSKFGWNVDHILPQSHGGKTVDYNLICCHILTNDEKANKFPCFIANSKKFEIQKKQKHYEIVLKSQCKNKNLNKTINFLDSTQGLRFWKQCKSHNSNVFVGYVKIKVKISNVSTQLLEQFENFLMELFNSKSIFVEDYSRDEGAFIYRDYYNKKGFIFFTIIDYKVSQKKFVDNLLNNCITLNTYRNYFINNTDFKNIQIVCGMECYKNSFEMSLYSKKDILEREVCFMDNVSLAIDELVKINTRADKELKNVVECDWYPYDYIWTRLEKNLSKLIYIE